MLLQFFVGIIDAELLEAVDLKSLEPVNVEDSDELVEFPTLSLQRTIDLHHNPVKEFGIYRFGKSITSKKSLERTGTTQQRQFQAGSFMLFI